MTAVPEVRPEITPVVSPTGATPVALLDQVPPAVVSVSVRVEPTHSPVAPPMAPGARRMLTVVVIRQPDPSV